MQKGSRAESLEAQHREILKKSHLWKNRPTTITKLEGGITNRNYKVQSGLCAYVARFGFPQNALLGINREHEEVNTARAARRSIGPEVTHHLPKHNLLVVRYIEGDVLNEKEARMTKTIVSVARLLRTLHEGGPWCVNSRDVFGNISEYITHAHARGFVLDERIKICLRDLGDAENILGVMPETACHFDLMLGNIVKIPQGDLKLIDWEYAANGDPRFDVAMFALKANLNELQEKTLLEEYNTDNEDVMFFTELQLMKMVVCMREASWGILQNAISEMKVEFDYQKYATEHLNRFDEIKNSFHA